MFELHALFESPMYYLLPILMKDLIKQWRLKINSKKNAVSLLFVHQLALLIDNGLSNGEDVNKQGRAWCFLYPSTYNTNIYHTIGKDRDTQPQFS